MVRIIYDDNFKKIFSKIKDNSFLEKIKKQIKKIIENPEVGKPMRNVRKRTKEVYIKSFRLSYVFHKERSTIEFLDIYHKKKQ